MLRSVEPEAGNCLRRPGGCGNGAMAEPVRHRQTKEAATDMFDLQPPRHIPTLPTNSGHRKTAAGTVQSTTSSRRSRHGWAMLPGPTPMRNFLQQLQADLPCPVSAAKIFRFATDPNHPYNSGHPVLRRGALAIVTNVGAGCGGRGSVRRERCLQGGLP
jgi:hypothetical protein